MTESLLFFSALLLPIAGIISISLVPHFIRAKANFVFVLLTAVVTSVPAIKALTGNSIEILINHTTVFGNLSIHIDSLSSWFILIINLTCINGAFMELGICGNMMSKNKSFSALEIIFTLPIFHALGLCIAKRIRLFACMGADVYFLLSACHL